MELTQEEIVEILMYELSENRKLRTKVVYLLEKLEEIRDYVQDEDYVEFARKALKYFEEI